MRILSASLWFVLGALAGGLACGPALTAQPRSAAPPPDESPLGLPHSMRDPTYGSALILDRVDLQLGTTVQYSRVPTVSELADLSLVRGLVHVVLTLNEWPPEYAPLEALNHLPGGADLIVVLPGYPPNRAAAQAWNLLDQRARIVVIANGYPPTGIDVELNEMRGLERLIVNTDAPSLEGLQRLQRPISVRWVRE